MKLYNIVGAAVRFVDRAVRSTAVKVAAAVALLLKVATPAHAQTFDYTVFSGTLTAGLIVVGTVAASIAAIMAGVIVWKKIAKYFNKAG